MQYIGVLLVCLFAQIYGQMMPRSTNEKELVATLTVRFVKFSNTRHLMSDGQRCDSGWFSSNKCDPHFTVCLTNIDASTWNNTNATDPLSVCDFAGPFTFGPYDNTGEVTFGDQLGGLKNPFVFNITHAWRGVEMRIRINEMERGSFLGANTAKGPIIDNFTYFFNGRPSGSMLRLRMTGSTAANTSLQLESRIQCLPNYYDAECSTYCVPRPEDHFTCDTRTGHIICEPGWTGDYCNAKMLAENLNIHPLTFGSQTDEVVAYEVEISNTSQLTADTDPLPIPTNVTSFTETAHTDLDSDHSVVNPIHVQVVQMEGTTIHEEEGHEPYFEQQHSNASAKAVTSGVTTVHPTPYSTVWPLTVSLLMGSLTYLATTSPSTSETVTEEKVTATTSSKDVSEMPSTTLPIAKDIPLTETTTPSESQNQTQMETTESVPTSAATGGVIHVVVGQTVTAPDVTEPTKSIDERLGNVTNFDEVAIVQWPVATELPDSTQNAGGYDIVQIVYFTSTGSPANVTSTVPWVFIESSKIFSHNDSTTSITLATTTPATTEVAPAVTNAEKAPSLANSSVETGATATLTSYIVLEQESTAPSNLTVAEHPVLPQEQQLHYEKFLENQTGFEAVTPTLPTTLVISRGDPMDTNVQQNGTAQLHMPIKTSANSSIGLAYKQHTGNLTDYRVTSVLYDIPVSNGLSGNEISDSSFLDKLNWTIHHIVRERLQRDQSENNYSEHSIRTAVEFAGLAVTNYTMQPRIRVHILSNEKAIFTSYELRGIVDDALFVLNAHKTANLYAAYIPHSPGLIMFLALLCATVVILLGVVIILARSSRPRRRRWDSPFTDSDGVTSNNCSLVVSAYDNPVFLQNHSEMSPAEDVRSTIRPPLICGDGDTSFVSNVDRYSDLSQKSGSHPSIARIRTTTTFRQQKNGGTL